MTNDKFQLDLFGQSDDDLTLAVTAEIRNLLNRQLMLAPGELLTHLEQLGAGGWRARWVWKESVARLREDLSLTRSQRAYLSTVLADEELDVTLHEGVKLGQEFKSSI